MARRFKTILQQLTDRLQMRRAKGYTRKYVDAFSWQPIIWNYHSSSAHQTTNAKRPMKFNHVRKDWAFGVFSPLVSLCLMYFQTLAKSEADDAFNLYQINNLEIFRWKSIMVSDKGEKRTSSVIFSLRIYNVWTLPNPRWQVYVSFARNNVSSWGDKMDLLLVRNLFWKLWRKKFLC